MAAAFSLIPELDEIVKNGTAEKRAEAIERISGLFLQGAAHFETRHVALFDDILVGLVPATEIETRAELAERLSKLDNAPPTLVKQLARETEIRVSGPILSRSPLLDDPTLVDIARGKGQEHLAAISGRPTLSPSVTDVIVRRGDREVVRSVAANAGAQFSESGYSGLIKRATDDGMLALTVGQREDLSAASLKQLVAKSVDVVRRRLFDMAKPQQKAAINQAMIELSGAPKSQPQVRDFEPAQRAILVLHQAGELDEAALLGFAKQHKYEESVAALAALTGMRISVVHQLVLGDRYDPVLLLGKSIGLEWATVRALVVLRLGPGRVASGPDIEEARINYDRLSPATAQRVLTFWRLRDKGKPA
ncbi:DUF2336 domain-containing protein [Afipia birgiae]|jgi:uncharacterized protein (DUF2336 family)|uniref:DUF2336 domain-containing protein n=1 Tax=Afipia birgiae TaxID=151414 RepID=UPI0003049643|nr:DUF2336 domain-containing protein [Afipia birgiae]MBX9820391.1 DUF2336 domain-containing protein [Afipia birgiae]